MANTDAQKIVAVSLGKIAASRATRSGINLYKSLMVSSILYKARTIVIMEKYNGPFTNCEKENDSSLETVEELQDCDDSSNDIPTTDIDDYDYDDQDDENCDEISDENQSSVSQENSSEPIVTSAEETSSEDKENSNQDNNQTSQGKTVLTDSSSTNSQVLKSCENTTQNLDNKEILKCERCTKRRYSDVESIVDNTSPKKLKNEDNEKSSENEQQEPTPMDGVQITQLVDSFTSGFTGLLSQGCNGTKSSNILQISGQNKRSSSCSNTTKSHGLSEGFSHCSSQIKESFETLASPIISLGITA